MMARTPLADSSPPPVVNAAADGGSFVESRRSPPPRPHPCHAPRARRHPLTARLPAAHDWPSLNSCSTSATSLSMTPVRSTARQLCDIGRPARFWLAHRHLFSPYETVPTRGPVQEHGRRSRVNQRHDRVESEPCTRTAGGSLQQFAYRPTAPARRTRRASPLSAFSPVRPPGTARVSPWARQWSVDGPGRRGRGRRVRRTAVNAGRRYMSPPGSGQDPRALRG
jgi:hypothetical protein